MKNVMLFLGRLGIPSAILLILTTVTSLAEIQSGQVVVKAVTGDVSASNNTNDWKPVKAADQLMHGTTIKTGPNANADLIVDYNGTVLRLLPDSILELSKLDKQQSPTGVITETSLNLRAGGLVGSQRKLAAPSRLNVKVPGGTATIVGTEYLVRADGAVTVLSGAVTVTYNLPGNRGSVKVTVQAGFSFDPATGQVVPTTPEYLVNIIADINTVRQNAQSFKTGGATVIVKPEEVMSPTGTGGRAATASGPSPSSGTRSPAGK
jgi:hypothetical protein